MNHRWNKLPPPSGPLFKADRTNVKDRPMRRLNLTASQVYCSEYVSIFHHQTSCREIIPKIRHSMNNRMQAGHRQTADRSMESQIMGCSMPLTKRWWNVGPILRVKEKRKADRDKRLPYLWFSGDFRLCWRWECKGLCDLKPWEMAKRAGISGLFQEGLPWCRRST